MARLIDADALMAHKFKNDISYNAFCGLVKRQPTVNQWHRVEDELPSMDGYDWVLGIVTGEAGYHRFHKAIMMVSFDCGQVICHIMRRGYIGKKVLVDVSTQSLRNLFRCGILEDYIPYEGRMRSIVNVGDRQRLLITHYPGVEIHECLSWGSYEQRQKAVGKGGLHQ